MSWRSTAFLKTAAATVFLVVALPALPQGERSGATGPQDALTRQPDLADTFSRWIQPHAASAAPRKASRQRKRARNARAQATKEEASNASATAAPTTSVVTEPLTPTIQVWPNAAVSAPSGTSKIVPIVVKTVREQAAPAASLAAASPENDAENIAGVVRSNEVSDIDLAAGPLPVPQVQSTTDGRAAAPEIEDTAAPVNRFAGFAQAVKSVPAAPWFEPVMIAMAGALAAFSAARIFLRA